MEGLYPSLGPATLSPGSRCPASHISPGMEVLLNGQPTLEARFAQIDVAVVRRELIESQRHLKKVLPPQPFCARFILEIGESYKIQPSFVLIDYA